MMIIDFHTHTFPSGVSERILEGLSETGHTRYLHDGSVEGLARVNEKAGIDYAVNLPVMTRANQVTSVNDRILRKQESYEKQGIISFGGLHPDFGEYREEIRKLKNNGIRGIKLHSAFHQLDISDIRYKRMIAAATEADMAVTIHAGIDISFLDHDYASVEDILEVVRDVQPTKFILAHMGGWQNWKKVEEELAGAPVWLDTSFSLGEVLIKPGHEEKLPYRHNLNQEAFVRLVRKHGADRVLFATDSPWSDSCCFLEFIRGCELSDREKQAILGENGAKLLKIEK